MKDRGIILHFPEKGDLTITTNYRTTIPKYAALNMQYVTLELNPSPVIRKLLKNKIVSH